MDWNNDGKQDLISGDSKGQVFLFLNNGLKGQPALAEGVLVQAGGKPIIGARPKYEKGPDGRYRRVENREDVMGIYSKLHLADWDGDGLKDLLVGQDGPGGQKMVWYKNKGTQTAPAFSAPQVLELPEPRMSRPSPYVVDWDGDGKMDLVCGTERPTVLFFRNKGSVASPELEEGRELKLEGDGFENGYRSRIDVADWNNDGKLDLLVGNFYSNTKPSGGNVWLFLGK